MASAGLWRGGAPVSNRGDSLGALAPTSSGRTWSAALGPRQILPALLLPLGCFLVQWLLWPTLSPFAWFLFYPAIIAAAWIGGIASGVSATLFSAGLVWWAFLPPEGSFIKQETRYFLALGMFVTMGGILSEVQRRLARAHQDRADALVAARIANGELAALAVENARLYRTAQQAVAARDDVLGVVVHDLRNPLNAILQASRLVGRGPDPERQTQKSAEVIHRSVMRMNRLVQDLLDVTCIDAGRLSIQRARVPAAQVVSDAVDAQRALAASASLDLRLDRTELPEVWADHDRLLQALENLIGNAIKFTDPGGRITVGAAPRDGEVLFWVADTGAGIAADEVPHVFERFWQSTRADRRGAGLGLPIVKGIIEAHGGRIWVESTPGRGSSFFFTVPVALRAPARTSEAISMR